VEKPSTSAKAEPVIEVVVKLDKGKERDIETSGEWKEPEDECEVDDSQEDPSVSSDSAFFSYFSFPTLL
jgi:hypothetical protein